MISAPNRLRLSNGSSLMLALGMVLFMGCASSSSVSKRPKVITPDRSTTKEVEEIPTRVDTISWTFVPESETPPISAESRVESFRLDKSVKERYRVALLLPMRLETVQPNLDANNRKFAEFYAGFKLAAEGISNVNLDIKTYYTNRDLNTLDRILQDLEFYNPDLVIGSYESEVIKRTAEWGRENRVPVISPWLSSTKVAEDNVFYLQLRPSITSYYEEMLRHINDNYEGSEVVLLGREEQDATKNRILRRLQEELSPTPLANVYQELYVEEEELMEGDSIFYEAFELGAKAFVLPHYSSSRDDRYVYSCLRKLYAEQAEREFTVYTMPILLRSERIDLNMLKNLNTRTIEFRFPDQRDPEIQQIRENYYRTYGWLPGDDAYYGYDLLQFIALGLEEHGQYFHYYMAGQTIDLSQMKIHIEPYFKDENEMLDDRSRPDFMSNRHLYVIAYENDHFVIKDIR
ncbi:MAG: hypothetical protein AAFQ02_08345 [Bacteroidota bacterium]